MQQQGPSTTKKQKQKAMLIILGGQQRDSAMYIHVSILRKLPSHPVCLITLSFLCYTVGPCLSSTLNTAVCTIWASLVAQMVYISILNSLRKVMI